MRIRIHSPDGSTRCRQCAHLTCMKILLVFDHPFPSDARWKDTKEIAQYFEFADLFICQNMFVLLLKLKRGNLL